MESLPLTTGTITGLLNQARAGDRSASDRLFGLLYSELRVTARQLLARSNANPRKVDATGLVNSACQRLIERGKLYGANRRHFFFQFVRAMRDVLVEEIRSDHAVKRGGGRSQVDAIEFAWEDGSFRSDMLDLNVALAELEKVDPVAANVVQLRFFGGLTLAEVADILPASISNVRDNWDYAKAWLRTRLEGHANGDSKVS